MARFSEVADNGICIPAGLPTLAERLREAGYWTIGVASNQFLFAPSGFNRGFDDWTEVGPRKEARPRQRPQLGALRAWGHVTKAAAEALNRRPRNKLFLYVHYMDVHDYPFQRIPYPKAVRAMDGALGMLLENLESAELLENATVIVTADHGERLGEQHKLRGRPGHYGNPAYQELLRIPLIVAPPIDEDPSAPLRSQDLHGLILRIAGQQPEPSEILAPGELYLGERRYQTYWNGRWKSILRREDGELFLMDLETDPRERRNFAEAKPEVAAEHRRRIREISDALAVDEDRPQRELTERERETLEVLGYVD